MSILGIKRIVFGVDDVERAAGFFQDFGLELAHRSAPNAWFELPEGSTVELRPADDPSLPAPAFAGNGPREIVWGVNSQKSLAELERALAVDRPVAIDEHGVLHTRDDVGLAIAFDVFNRHEIKGASNEENTPSDVRRWNRHRRWYDRARPKLIFHVVFGVPDVDRGVHFYTTRLGFRVTDINRGLGIFMRCDGRHEHHNLFLLQSERPMFSHVSFGVDNIDELMAGANHMQRKGWSEGMGLGRHRVSSLAFYYVKSPAGGQAEYSADGDYLTDEWKPRVWEPRFGHIHWLGQVPKDASVAAADFEIVEGKVPTLAETKAGGRS